MLLNMRVVSWSLGSLTFKIKMNSVMERIWSGKDTELI